MTDKKEQEKQEEKDGPYLIGRLLLAMPNMGDPRFHKAVVFVCAHDENGAMGLVINHLLPGVDLSELLKQLDIDLKKFNMQSKATPVMSGGPVETARGFILHSNDFTQKDTIKVNNEYSVTGTVDALKAVAEGSGPDQMLFVLGYAGWSAGQLDEEIQQNAWLVADPDPDVIFDSEPDDKWGYAVKKLGIDPCMLSSNVGRA